MQHGVHRWTLVVLLVAHALGCGEAGPAAEVQTGSGSAVSSPTRAEADSGIARAPSASDSRAACPGEVVHSEVFDQLKADRFAEVEQTFVELHHAYTKEPGCELELMELTTWLAIEGHLPYLESFVTARPDAWAAHALRGIAYVDRGIARRGTAFANKVTDAQWAGMREAFALARTDLTRSLELAPANLIATRSAIRAAKQSGDQKTVISLLTQTLERDPLTYEVREAAIQAFSPYWGGSVEAMAEIAADAQAHADRNPRLRGLQGQPVAMRAKVLRFEGKLDESIAMYRRALSAMPHNDWYKAICSMLSRKKDYDALFDASDEWLRFQGPHFSAYTWRGKAKDKLGRHEEALADLGLAVEMAPGSTWALSSRGYVFEHQGRNDLAIADYRRVLEIKPRDLWALEHLSELLVADAALADEAEGALRRWAQISPADLEPRFLLGKLLHQQGDARAGEVLRGYVAEADDDGDEAARLAQARRWLTPRLERQLPALEHLGLVSSSSS